MENFILLLESTHIFKFLDNNFHPFTVIVTNPKYQKFTIILCV